jgi:monovalent cation/hydrogen antiporter
VHEIEFLMLLLLAVALLAQLAGRVQIPYPVFLVCGGLAIALIPGTPRIDLHPDIVFLVFLPPLLYAAALRRRRATCASTPAGSRCSRSRSSR